jgi:hypothetical protein
MSCDICGRGGCTESFHSLEEQARYEKVIAAFERAREMRAEVREELRCEDKHYDNIPEAEDDE